MALPRRGLETLLERVPLPPIPRNHPAIGKYRGKGSLSIGTTRDGILVGGVALPPEGPHHRIMTVHAGRGTNWATDEVVMLLQDGVRAVSKKMPGAVLPVGNMSRSGGGDIIWSISHNAGRDADIGFYLLDGKGRPFFADVLVGLDAKGRGRVNGTTVRLDVRRMWLLAKAFVTHPATRLQWMFVSDALKKLIVEEGQRRKEKPDVIARVEAVMAQPSLRRPHNDHIHLRVYCSRDDAYEGCQDKGSNRPWFEDQSPRIARRARELMGIVRKGTPTEQADAAVVLGRIGWQAAFPLLLTGLGDSSPQVRRSSAGAILDLGAQGRAKSILEAINAATDGEVVATLLAALDRTLAPGPRAAALGNLLREGREYVVDMGVFRLHERLDAWASRALVGRSVETETVQVLIDALTAPDTQWRAVHETLCVATGVNPIADGAGTDREGAHAAWSEWWKAHRRLEPVKWYEEAARLAGAIEGKPDGDDAVALADLVRRQDHRWRAAVVLLRVIGRAGSRLPPDGIQPLARLVDQAVGRAGDEAIEDDDPAD